jgi:hypothetical protein
MNTIIMRCISVSNWKSKKLWDDYLKSIENCLEDKLYKVDSNDPLKRKSNSLCSDGEYIVDAKPNEIYRVVFGSFIKSKIEFDIHHHKNIIDEHGEVRFNSISFQISSKNLKQEMIEKIIKVFNITNIQLNCFYSFCDYDFRFRHLKTLERRLNISKELAGIFWLTYFNKQYVDFFKLNSKFDEKLFKKNNYSGITIQMADSPEGCDDNDYLKLEEIISPKAFFRNSGSNHDGEHVITLENIK